MTCCGQPLLAMVIFMVLIITSKKCRRPWFNSWVGKILWRRNRLPTPVFLSFPCGSAGKEPACNAGDLYLLSMSSFSTNLQFQIYCFSYIHRFVLGLLHCFTFLFLCQYQSLILIILQSVLISIGVTAPYNSLRGFSLNLPLCLTI